MILGIAGLLIVAGIAAFVLLFTQTQNQKIYNMIEAEKYGIAYQGIQEQYDKGKNVDSLVYELVDACLNHAEYKRAVAAMNMLSAESDENTAFYTKVIETLVQHEKTNRAGEVLDMMTNHSEALRNIAQEMKIKYGLY